MENIALRIWQILYTFVLRVENNTQLDISKVYNILQPNFAVLLSLGYSFKLR